MNEYDIFIMCGGKCGGSTLAYTFHRNNFKTTHIHGINNTGAFQSDINLELGLFNIIDNSSKNKKIYIIDSYRTPIERKISAFFQHIGMHLPNYKELSIEELILFFNENVLENIENYHPINESLIHYNIPLFKSFDFVNKYNKVEHENKVFIKLLFTDIDKWDEILSNILETTIEIYPHNLTSNKEIYKLYKKFNEKYIPPSSYIDYVLNDEEFKIYNTKQQQEEYIYKWSTILNKTLIGKNGYLFLQNDSGNELKIHNENLCLVKDVSLQRYYEYKDKLLLTVFPNKSLLYKDFLPDDFDMKYRPAFDIYKKVFDDKIIDGYSVLHNYENTFYKTDTHINLNGAYIIYYTFIDKINSLFGINIVKKEIEIKNKLVNSLNELNSGIGDLTWKINLGNQNLESTEDVYYYSNDFTEIYLKYKVKVNDPLRIIRFDKKELIDNTDDFIDKIIDWDMLSQHILYKKNNIVPKIKCLIFYDSFLLSTLGLYLELFDEVYLSKSVFSNEIVEIINPDYICEFRIERFLF
jgi:hypothetical protein